MNQVPDSSEEQRLWIGTPSQITNLPLFLGCGTLLLLVGMTLLLVRPPQVMQVALLVALLVPITYTVYEWLRIQCYQYEVTSERIRISTGILNRVTEEVELYRVKDSTLEEPFFLRLFGLGTIVLQTSDRSMSVVVLRAVPKPRRLWETLRSSIEHIRATKRVREVDLE